MASLSQLRPQFDKITGITCTFRLVIISIRMIRYIHKEEIMSHRSQCNIRIRIF